MSSYTYNPQQYQQSLQAQVIVGTQVDISKILLYQIKGKPAFAYADINVQPGQRVITDGNMMMFMDEGLASDVGTECWGGCCDSLLRTWAGERCCFNTFLNTSQNENRLLTVGYNDPGDLLSFGVTPGNGWILTKDAFVAGTDNLSVSGKCIGCCACMFSGEGAFLTHVKLMNDAQAGVFLAGNYGALVRHDIPQGQVLYVTKGLFFAAHETTRFRIGLAGGLKNLCCSKGAICMLFYGPAVVYTQSRDPLKWNPYKNRPRDQNKKKSGTN